MIANSVNPNEALVAKVEAHVANRVTLLASCSRAATGMNNSATNWARAELLALKDGLTDMDAIQRAVCEKFPKVTGNGKVSKTPNSSFKTSFDKFVLIAAVIAGEHKTYTSDAALKLATAFRDEAKLTLNDVVDQIKADHAAAGREARANETEEEKAARKAREAAEGNGVVAGIVANDGAVMLALAKRIADMDLTQATAFADPLAKLMEAVEAKLVEVRDTTSQPEADKLAA